MTILDMHAKAVARGESTGCIIRVMLPGAPRTKKNSPRVFMIGKIPKVLPSKAYCEWFDNVLSHAILIQRPIVAACIPLPLDNKVEVSADIYMERDSRADECGFMQAIGDCIQAPVLGWKKRKDGRVVKRETRQGLGIIRDDYQIHWTGVRIGIDRQRPRIELAITVIGEPRSTPVQPGMFEDEEPF